MDSSDPNYYYVPYAITGALLGKTVFVYVAPIPAKFIGPRSGDVPIVNQISGPAHMTISNSNLHVSNVDFEIIFEAIT